MLTVAVQRRFGSFALDVAFELPTPSVIALFGRSGCGKTSTVNLVAGLAVPERGRVEVDGEVLTDTDRGLCVPPERRRVGYVFQDGRLFPHLSVEGNLRYGLRRARGAAQPASFDDLVALLELGPLLARRTHELSGGERQRVALGRALLAAPRLLLLDEPLSALDAGRRGEVLPHLERLRDEFRVPMVLVSHQLDEVLRLASHLVLLEAGRVVAAGTVAGVALHPALRALVGPDAVGAVLEARVAGTREGLTTLALPAGELRVAAVPLPDGARARVQVLARDLILATRRPEGLSVRNCLPGRIVATEAEAGEAELVTLDCAGQVLLARVTRAAARELRLVPGMDLWVLVKAVSVRPAVPH